MIAEDAEPSLLGHHGAMHDTWLSCARIAIAAVLAAGLAGSCSSRIAGDARRGVGTLAISTRSSLVLVNVEIAETDTARRAGLMNRTSLGADSGMAFLFDGPTDSGFWMKDTLIPLSIAFWGSDDRIVAMLDMRPCTSDPCPLYSPHASYVGALEVNLGYFAAHGVEVADSVEVGR